MKRWCSQAVGGFASLRRPIDVLSVAIVVAVGLMFASGARAGTCQVPVTVGLDTSYANSYGLIELGWADGETFFAPDTEIQAITAWRFAADAGDASTWRIFIMGLDSLGVPNPYDMIQDGPTLQIVDGGSPHMTPFRFVFDPPVILPSIGKYEFAIQGDGCQGYFGVAANHSDGLPYPDGEFWSHGREASYCLNQPRADPTPNPNADLIFSIEFCSTADATRPTSWGRIKALYR